MSSLVSDLLDIKTVKSAFVASSTGEVIEKSKNSSPQQIAAVGAYVSHCLKPVEGELGMMELSQIKISGGTKTLMLNFKDDKIFAVEAGADLPCNLVTDYFEDL